MSSQSPAGWYPVDEHQERYWDGSTWTEQSRPKAPTGPPSADVSPTSAPKKKRRIFLWVFLAIQVLFIIWVISAGASSGGTATDCGSLDQDTCEAAEDIGAGIGTVFVIILWMIVDFFLAVGYGVYRLAKRP